MILHSGLGKDKVGPGEYELKQRWNRNQVNKNSEINEKNFREPTFTNLNQSNCKAFNQIL